MKVFVKSKGEINLSKQDFVASGGEGSIYRKNKTAFKILKALVKSVKEGKGLTSEELIEKVEPTIGSVIYHLKKLMKAGLVVKLDSTYELKMKSLHTTIEEIEKDIALTLVNIKNIALDIDDKIGLEHR